MFNIITYDLFKINFLQGDGTRKGNGICKCNSGYSGDNCDQCANNYFAIIKNETLTCKKCHKSCKNGCTDSGSKGIIIIY